MNLDPDRSRLLHAEKAADAQRLAIHEREAMRASGVAWSGFAPDACARRNPAELRRAAERRLEALQRRRLSRPGRLLAALAEAERAVEALRAALARGLAPDDRRYAQALCELETAAADARSAIRD